MIGERIRHDLQRRRGSVAGIEDLSPRLRRVTIALEERAAPVPHLPMAVGDHVKLAFPHPQTGNLDLQDQPVLRDYTIRAVPDEGHLVVDIVIHGTGPASTWASTASEGSLIGVLGPRGSHIMPDDRARYFLLGDESAFPALSRWLEEAPTDADLFVALETEDGTTAELPHRLGSTVKVVRGAGGEGLVEALTAWQPRPGDGVWAAGETTAMIAVRNAAKDLGVAKEDLAVDGYWKRGVAGRDHHEPLDA